jgi:uncharacterized protein
MNPHNNLSPITLTPRPARWGVFFRSVSFLLLIPGLALADSPSPTPAPESKINLDAVAHKRLPNTVADVTLAIQVDGRTGDAVSNSLSQRSQTLLDFLRQQGVERLQTEQVTFEPQTEPVRGGPDRVVGFTGNASVSFRTTPEKLGTLLSGSLDHGANTVIQTEFTPAESEIVTARRDLAIEATKIALARADAIAQAAGERVVRIENINVQSEEAVTPLPFRATKEMDVSSPSIATSAGEQEISVRVSVQVAIER